jgi:hypothetical protein
MNNNYPSHLRFNGRIKLSTRDFKSSDKLFHGCEKSDINENLPEPKPKLETIRFPDFSCNWDRFSSKEDIWFRKNGKPTDGCYSFTVETSRFENIATPVHDPLKEDDYENYAHVEVREIYADKGENIYFEPPKGRKIKSKKRKDLRQKYRQNIVNNSNVDLPPEA